MKSRKEKILILLYSFFGKHLPQSNHLKTAKNIRGFFARKIMKSTGKNINIERGAVFNSQVTLDDNSGIGVNCEIHGPVMIGKNVNMGPEVIIYTHNHASSRTDIPMQQQGSEKVKPVLISDDCWLGRRVIILPGVKIGRGSILGAGTVVAKDIPEYSIVVGNPAKVIKNRKDLEVL
ncbi:hypothetical protein AUC31_14950 [Planococcus rifietoensis]|uniref:Acetyltransferase n=1 Tax=Planococcus rifietoensis TaxID=200991 RepID=A0A0U2ZK61_9BACL|nr:acyltransferase [Planococcus rifietoensis]ALS76417.1 hypothetical protein AUC31_14950 [Planococcus rifietoensis]